MVDYLAERHFLVVFVPATNCTGALQIMGLCIKCPWKSVRGSERVKFVSKVFTDWY